MLDSNSSLPWLLACFLLSLSVTSCCEKSSRPVDPLRAGVVLRLPVQGDFPRPGLQWNYEVFQQGFPNAKDFPPEFAYRFIFSDQKKRLWNTFFYYAGRPEADGTYEQIEPTYIFMHPPRSLGFRVLEWAPFPVATPGKEGSRQRKLELGRGWEPHVGEVVPQEYTDVGRRCVIVPAGKFSDAWYVVGKTPGWNAEFWWVDHVGWARMFFLATDGRRLDLRLSQVRETGKDVARRQ